METLLKFYKRNIFTCIIVLLLTSILLISGCVETSYQQGNGDEEKPLKTEELKILNHNLEYSEYGNLMVVGTAENVASKQLSYAEIKVKFYDKDNALIDTSLDNINDLDVGEKWKFKVIYLGMDTYNIDTYEIAVGSTWWTLTYRELITAAGICQAVKTALIFIIITVSFSLFIVFQILGCLERVKKGI